MFNFEQNIDQAQGLRLIANRKSTRVIPILSNPGDPEQTAILAHLSIALHRLGERILILDAGRALIGSWFGISLRYELNHLLNAECGLHQILKPSNEGVWIMSAATGLEPINSSPSHQHKLSETFSSLPKFDVCIVLAPFAALYQMFRHDLSDLWMITSTKSKAMSSTYARIKGVKMQQSNKRIHMIYGGVSDAEQCERSHQLMSESVRRGTNIQLAFGGAVAQDVLMRQATLERRTVFSYAPNSVLAMTFEQIAIALSRRILTPWLWIDAKPSLATARSGLSNRTSLIAES